MHSQSSFPSLNHYTTQIPHHHGRKPEAPQSMFLAYSGGRHVTVHDFWVFKMLREKTRKKIFTADHPGGLVSLKKCSAALEKSTMTLLATV
jgi:hypothetical protein